MSTLDLCGHGRFTLLTGIVGEAWCQATAELSAELGLQIACHVTGPRQAYVDHGGDWAQASEIVDNGCLLVRPDHDVAWRSEQTTDDPKAGLSRVLGAILAH